MSGHTTRARTDHPHAAQQAREMPGRWVLAGTYGSRASAVSATLQVRTGERVPSYRPAGTFEARTELTQDGADLWVRYVGADVPRLTESFDAYSRRLNAVATRKDT